MTHYSPTVRRRRLSVLLRRYREQTGKTADEIAKILEWTPSTVTRMERGEWRRPSLDALKSLLHVYGVTDPEERLAVLALAREARQRGWWEEYKDIWGVRSLPEFEAEATRILAYRTLLVPGLLQTADYARAVVRGGKVLNGGVIERRVRARLERQRILNRGKPPFLWALIDEAALRKRVGGAETMAAQVRHIAEMATRPNIAIQVITDEAGAHAAMEGPFTILQFSGDPPLVHVEMLAGERYLELPGEVDTYTVAYDHVRASALSADASVEFLANLADQLLK